MQEKDGGTIMSKQKRQRTGPGGPGQPKPQWQPISMLPTLSTHIDGMLEADLEQYQTLQLARSKPHVLDDYTVNRVKKVFTEQRNGLALFDAQLHRWLAEPLTDEQRREVERLVEQMRRIRENNANVLALADELSKGTIEKVMAKSDLELGIEALMKEFLK
jgi:hypothetical protein